MGTHPPPSPPSQDRAAPGLYCALPAELDGGEGKGRAGREGPRGWLVPSHGDTPLTPRRAGAIAHVPG